VTVQFTRRRLLAGSAGAVAVAALSTACATTAHADYRVIPYVSRAGAPVSTRASFTIPAGDPGLQRIA
jgi:hypothetical protein